MSKRQLKISTNSIFAFLLLLILATSCNKKTLQISSYEQIKVKDIVAVLDTSHLEFEEMKARFKIKANLNGNNKSFNADLRWERNEQIWMSFSIFGFEGVRALFTQDSVKIMNKLQKQYFYGNYKDLEQISQVPLTFVQVENLLLGKLFEVKDNKPDIQIKGSSAIIQMEDELYSSKAEIDKASLSIQHYLITSWLGKRSLDVTLADYQQINNKNWPTKRDYNIVSGNNYLKIDATAQKITLDEQLEYPFYINPKYEKIPLEFFR